MENSVQKVSSTEMAVYDVVKLMDGNYLELQANIGKAPFFSAFHPIPKGRDLVKNPSSKEAAGD